MRSAFLDETPAMNKDLIRLPLGKAARGGRVTTGGGPAMT